MVTDKKHDSKLEYIPLNGKPAEEIKQSCLKKGTLFEDFDFPPLYSSLFHSKIPDAEIEWKRPHELCSEPHFSYDGASRNDIQQGMLGNCWFLASIVTLTQNQKLLAHVMPPEQTLDSNSSDYCGLIYFRFWQFGEWYEVVIDDRLPTQYGRLMFLYSEERCEFWSALFEKAYAKLHGSYEALAGGNTCDAMQDFTGGITQSYRLEKAPKNLFSIITTALLSGSLICCVIDEDANVYEAKLCNGLIMGHAYTVTRAHTISHNNTQLIRIRNPWGDEQEWLGAWSDMSMEWKDVDEMEIREIDLRCNDDGEFWMSMEDFIENFSCVDICTLVTNDPNQPEWASRPYYGSWKCDFSAGGCAKFQDTFFMNPQIGLNLEEERIVVVAVMQKDRRKVNKHPGHELYIGFAIYEIPQNLRKYKKNGNFSKEFFSRQKCFARPDDFSNKREMASTFTLPRGEYVIVPSTFNSGEEGNFLLRLRAVNFHS